MADIEDGLTLLSKQINLCTGINLTIDHLRLAHENEQNVELVQRFWSTLNVLSHCAMKKINPELNFQHYGEIKSTKLCFAYLGYNAIEFYGLTEKVDNSRGLLIALGWLIAVHDCFNSIVHEKLIESLMGREFINTENCIVDNEQLNENIVAMSMSSQIHSLIHKCNKINNNLKEIAELIAEKIRLISKIHRASLNINNLPHLNTLEICLIKKLFTKATNKDELLQQCEREFDELYKIGLILQVNAKWKRKEEIFFNWMETALEDSRNESTNQSLDKTNELSTIICIIRHLTKKKIHTIKLPDSEITPNKIINNLSTIPCASKFLRINKHLTDNHNNNETKLLQQLTAINQQIEKKMEKFNCELKYLVKKIPNCLQV